MFKKIKTKKVYIKIVEQIRSLIREGKLKLGDKLPPEQELAKKFGISRPSVREAICALEISGIVERQVGRGSFIKSNNYLSSFHDQIINDLEEEESPFELLEARKVLEVEFAGLASQKGTKKDITAIERAFNKMKSAVGDISKWLEYDQEFHREIAQAAHNNFLFSVMIKMNDLLQEKLWINMIKKVWDIPDYSKKSLKEHNEILVAIKHKNREKSRQKMHHHLAEVEKDILRE